MKLSNSSIAIGTINKKNTTGCTMTRNAMIPSMNTKTVIRLPPPFATSRTAHHSSVATISSFSSSLPLQHCGDETFRFPPRNRPSTSRRCWCNCYSKNDDYYNRNKNHLIPPIPYHSSLSRRNSIAAAKQMYAFSLA